MKGKFTPLFALLLVVALLTVACSAPASSGNADQSAAPKPAASSEPSIPADEVYTYADTIAWDGEYNVIVVGFGGAGAAAAIAAADEGANVLLTEKAPEGHEGGNTKYCAQLFVTAADYDKTLAYYKALRGDFASTSDAVLEAYVKGLSNLKQHMVDLGVDEKGMTEWTKGPISNLALEYPELPGGEGIATWTIDQTIAQGALWNFLRKKVFERSDKIDVWFDSPGEHLIQDPVTKTIIGVQIEKNGQLVNIRAKDGVVLASGGFENNQEMVETYLGFSKTVPIGTAYNTGDGIRMAQAVGANLWHMNNWESNGVYAGNVHESVRALGTYPTAFLQMGSLILVGDDGTRYMREDLPDIRHGHVYYSGSWIMQPTPEHSFVVFDQAQFESGPVYHTGWSKDNLEEVEKGYIIKADTLEELAEKMGFAADKLTAEVKEFNASSKSGNDRFGRPKEKMQAFDNGPYYAMPLTRCILNTQGGPERDENARIIDTNGNPIPNLYSAGELGGITAHLYQGGGNVAECLVFGDIAGKNAAAPKAALPAYTPAAKVESNLQYTIGVGGSSDESAQTTADNEFIGEGSGMGGTLKVKLTKDGDKIAAVEVISHAETEGIGDKAIEQLVKAIVDAQSADVDVVGGATLTSNAVMAAVKDALS